jgi:ABC transporter substrate binding protein (PQQ-dependent alcohol dehydrogenase system)
VQQQMAVFTQITDDYDVAVVADESEIFGPYLPFRTWSPRPVAGTSGLVPMSWHPAHEQWGATQMQNRFHRLAGRGGADAPVRNSFLAKDTKDIRVDIEVLQGKAFVPDGKRK